MAFIQRLVMHYDHRRYPLAHLPAIKSAWRISQLVPFTHYCK